MTVPVNHEVLQWARESIHLSLEEVARKINKRVEVIVDWETGSRAPTYVQLERLAYDVYKRPLAIFFFPEVPEEEEVKSSFRTLPETEFNQIPHELMKLIKNARVMQLNLKELTGDLITGERHILKNLSVSQDMAVDEAAELVRDFLDITIDEQMEWRTSDEALARWRNALEGVGIYVFKEAFRNNGFSGFCLYDADFPVIYVNNSMPKNRQIFTLFHELAHLLFKTAGVDKVGDEYIDLLSGTKKKVEVFCNQFAAAFLVPNDHFDQKLLRKPTIDDILVAKLATEYSVSREVILRKLLDRGMVTQVYYQEMADLWTSEAARGKGGGGNYYATKVAYLGDRYLELAFGEYYRRSISLPELADYLDVKATHVPALENAWQRKMLR